MSTTINAHSYNTLLRFNSHFQRKNKSLKLHWLIFNVIHHLKIMDLPFPVTIFNHDQLEMARVWGRFKAINVKEHNGNFDSKLPIHKDAHKTIYHHFHFYVTYPSSISITSPITLHDFIFMWHSSSISTTILIMFQDILNIQKWSRTHENHFQDTHVQLLNFIKKKSLFAFQL